MSFQIHKGKFEMQASILDDFASLSRENLKVYPLIADRLHLPEEFIDIINYAAPIHDIGNIGIPDTIFLKPEN